MDLQELADKCEECADDAWRQATYEPYPEDRMAHFLAVVSGALARAIQDRLAQTDLWAGPYIEVSHTVVLKRDRDMQRDAERRAKGCRKM